MTRRRHIVRGHLTRVNLAAAQAVFAPPVKDAWGRALPPFDPDLARLCAELSAATYDLEVERFFDAGWVDCTFQAENRLFDAIDGPVDRPVRALRRGIRMKRARGAVRVSPGDVLRGVRQLVATDTGKVLTMALPLQEGRAVVAVSFMGTSRKFYDWVTNMKMSCRDGMHEGFSQVARQVLENAERIAYPQAAAALGRERLTLRDAVELAAQPDSPVRLLVCGHSQGGASAQAYVHLLISEQGALRENLLGYTFAAPTVAGLVFAGDPASYPVYNVVNADDFVPRIGSYMRLGTDMLYVPDEDFRAVCYGWSDGPEAEYARERVRRLFAGMVDTPTVIAGVAGMCRALRNLPDARVAERTLGALNAGIRYLTPAMAALGMTAADIIGLLERQLILAYRSVTDENLDEERLEAMARACMDLLSEVGPEAFTRAVSEVTLAPHGISREPGRTPPYVQIVQRCQDSLRPHVWHARDGRAMCEPEPGSWFALAQDIALQEGARPLALESGGTQTQDGRE